jgi:hypothetical protein
MGRGAFVLGGPGGVGTEVATGFGNGNVRVGGDGYRDRAAERRGLYGVPPLAGRNDNGGVESGGYGRQGPPRVDEPPVQFERVDQSRALGAQNVGNKMLRNMGWQEGQVRRLFFINVDCQHIVRLPRCFRCGTVGHSGMVLLSC